MDKIITRLLCPHVTQYKKTRIGGDVDGGYVICETDIVPDALYSYGSNDKISFERDFYSKYNKPCYVYDHTIDGITDKPDYVHFFKEGIGSQKTHELDTLSSHISMNNHGNCKNLFLQMDIEGAEWDVLVHQPIEQFSQMIIELHMYPYMFSNPMFLTKIIGTLSYINKYFIPVHVHGNNACSPENRPWLVDGVLPMCMEVTYLRKDAYPIDETVYPIQDLDKDNNPKLPSMKLDWSRC